MIRTRLTFDRGRIAIGHIGIGETSLEGATESGHVYEPTVLAGLMSYLSSFRIFLTVAIRVAFCLALSNELVKGF